MQKNWQPQELPPDPELLALLEELEFKGEILPKALNGEPDRSAPLWWLQECIETYDEHWQEKGLAGAYSSFPNLPYWPWLFGLLMTEKRIHIPKSREMMLSWVVVGYGVWRCQVFPRTRFIIQSQKEDKSIELVKGTGVPGYARTLYERQSARLQAQFPLTKAMEDMPANQVSWQNGSVVMGVAAGADQIRMYHPTVMMFDEACPPR